jgi:hypothetical protein
MIVLVLGMEVMMERLMFPFGPTVLVAPRTFGVMPTVKSPGLGVQRLVTFLVFLAKFVMDLSMLPPAVMSKG